MGAWKRVQKYRSVGCAADLARVEVLVPPDPRSEEQGHMRALACRSAAFSRYTSPTLTLCSNRNPVVT